MKKYIITILVLVISLSLVASYIFIKTDTEDKSNYGIIEGSLSYPSSFIPSDMEICAEDIVTKEQYCTQKHIEDEKYTYGIGYKIEAPAGNYYVFAMVSDWEDYRAYHSEFVICDFEFNPECSSHIPIVVTVEIGKIVEKIDPGDWYTENSVQ